MNSVKSGKVFLPRLRADEIQQNQEYSAKTIRRVKTKFGDSYVLESDEFAFFLPRRFSKLEIPEVLDGRHFMITGMEPHANGRQSPKIVFFMKNRYE